ncbi:MAG: Lrp/AsnC ligand binding domain-containing protein [Paludibacteraceae bacterium]|nr:Lrp/AsnC ligand binding domain-containing protein [Paludibacteraceae bacterium]
MEVNTVERIDALDRKILKVITRNARIPFKDVAEQCGVSRAAIHQRVQKLFDTGVIVGSGYQVNPKMLGYNLCVYVGITLEKGSMYNDVVRALEQVPEVVESHFMLGSFSMLIKLYARDDRDLLSLLNTKIQMIPGVSKTETLTSLEQHIDRTLPIE